MIPQNNYLIIQPIKKGMITAMEEGNEYLVIDAPIRHMETDKFKEGIGEFKNYDPGDTVIVEQDLVIWVIVAGKETFFVKEENVLAKIFGPKKDN